MIPQLLHKLSDLPWLIRQDALNRYIDTLQNADPKDIRSFFFIDDLPEIKPLTYTMTHIGNQSIANIALQGPIIHKAEDWEKRWYGAVDTIEAANLIRSAGDDSKIHSILLHIDSPGGTAIGAPELADAVNEVDLRKPIIAHVDGLCCSGAYWVASQCRHILATRSSHIGCVGVYLALLDMSAWYEQEGLRREVIKNSEGTHKAAGYPGTSLTDEQRAALQEQMDEIHNDFVQSILSARGDQIPENAFNGFSYTAPEAEKLNLIDAIASPVAALTLASRES